jgi:hypothetical protein
VTCAFLSYGEKVFTWCLSSDASLISSRVGAPDHLRERTARLLSEATGLYTENVSSIKGLSSYESIPVTPIIDMMWKFLFSAHQGRDGAKPRTRRPRF